MSRGLGDVYKRQILHGQYNQPPYRSLLCGQHDLSIIAREFLAACVQIDIGLSDFIYARLMEQPLEHVKHNAGYTDHPAR